MTVLIARLIERFKREAEEAGMSVEQYRQFVNLKRENDMLLELQRQAQTEKWFTEASALKAKYPHFDLASESENPLFVKLLQSDIPMKQAYEMIHKTSENKKNNAGVIIVGLLLCVVGIAIGYMVGIGSPSSKNLSRSEAAHEIAEIARSVGLPEDNPIIVEAKAIWEADSSDAVRSSPMSPESSPRAPATPAPQPKSGEIILGYVAEEYESELTIKSSSSWDSYIVLNYSSRPNSSLSGAFPSIFAFYVRAGDEVTVSVPQGTATLYYATGETWYGKKNKFGENTAYSASDDIFDFTNYTWEVTLYPVVGGDFDTYTIDPEDFPA